MSQPVTDHDLIKCWGVERTCVLFPNVCIYIIMLEQSIYQNLSDYSVVGKDNWLKENVYCF